MSRDLLRMALLACLLLPALVCAAETVRGAETGGPETGAGDGAVQSAFAERFFSDRVLPVLVEHCYECHGNGRHKGQLNLESLSHVLQGGEDGAVVVPGDPAKSPLITSIRWEATDPDQNMPPKAKLSDAAIADLTRWVEMGAPWPVIPATAPAAPGAAAPAGPPAQEPPARLPPLLGRLHPVIVHFPIACLLLALLAEGLVLLRGPAWRPFTAFLVLLGTLAAGCAVLTGTWLASGEDAALKRHELLGWTTLVCALVSSCLLWVPQRWILRIALVVTAAAVGLTGHLGGLLVYGRDWFNF